MKLLIVLMMLTISPHAFALDATVPQVTGEAASYMPRDTSDFGSGIWDILARAFEKIRPDLTSGARICIGIAAVVLLVSLIHTIPGAYTKAVDLGGSAAISLLFLQSANGLISLAAQTIRQLSDYGKLLVPVLASAMAAQGGVSSSAGIYGATIAFDAVLCGLVSKILLPMMYAYLAVCVCNGALEESILKKMLDLIKWLSTWTLKIILYVFTGYMGITGVVSGTTDAAALKAAKIAISSMVPVVGGIMSDASEAVLVGAGVVKNSAGIYGILALLATVVGPFLKIGSQYLMLKVTGILCAVIGEKKHTGLIEDFTSVMGMLLGMTGSVCLLLMISIVCFLKGVG